MVKNCRLSGFELQSFASSSSPSLLDLVDDDDDDDDDDERTFSLYFRIISVRVQERVQEVNMAISKRNQQKYKIPKTVATLTIPNQ